MEHAEEFSDFYIKYKRDGERSGAGRGVKKEVKSFSRARCECKPSRTLCIIRWPIKNDAYANMRAYISITLTFRGERSKKKGKKRKKKEKELAREKQPAERLCFKGAGYVLVDFYVSVI